MKAVDTHILVRLVTRDNPGQFAKVRRALEAAESAHEKLFVSDVVAVELIWALSWHYDYPRDDVLRVFDSLLQLQVLEFESADEIRELVALGRSTHLELDDLLIGLVARRNGCEATLTFDKAAAKSPLFELL